MTRNSVKTYLTLVHYLQLVIPNKLTLICSSTYLNNVDYENERRAIGQVKIFIVFDIGMIIFYSLFQAEKKKL